MTTIEANPASSPARRPRVWTTSDLIAAAFLVAVAALVVIPLLSLVLIAFGETDIWADLAAYVIPDALRVTALLLAGVAALTAATGVGAAWLVTAYRFPGRDALAWALALPLAFPTYIVAYVYVDLFDAFGPVQTVLAALAGWKPGAASWYPNIRSLPGAIFVFSLVLYPYVFLAARAMFQTQSACLFEVARTLGATRFMLARHVALPLARPALAVGLSLALLETLNDIGACEYLGVRTLTLSIFTTWLNRSSLPGAAQIACLMLVAIAALIALERHGRRDKRFHLAMRRAQPPAPIVLTGWTALAASALCALPVVLGFVVPALDLAYEAAHRSFDPDLVRAALYTVLFAAVATVAALVLGFGAVMAARMLRSEWTAWALTLAGLGYAVPGTVLALALLSPLVAIDEGLNAVSRAVAGVGVGLVVAGSGAAIVIAYVVRFLTIATGSAQAGLARISTRVDDAARTLGQKPGAIMRLIHVPLSRPALGGAALLIVAVGVVPVVRMARYSDMALIPEAAPE
jgi:iron(III) transport system permease protein